MKLPKLNEVIKKSSHKLNADQSYIIFNLGLSISDKAYLDAITIHNTTAYDNFGKLESVSSDVQHFLMSLGPNNSKTSQAVAELISRLTAEIISGFDKETAWLTVRASVATDSWDMPRWHTDGYYYRPYEGDQYKVAITLKGPSSLFYLLPATMREEFNALQYHPDNRDKLAQLLHTAKAHSADAGEGAIFVVGSKYAAVHSEPPIHEQRLFLSVVPGNTAEIAELYTNWHPKK